MNIPRTTIAPPRNVDLIGFLDVSAVSTETTPNAIINTENPKLANVAFVPSNFMMCSFLKTTIPLSIVDAI